MISVDESRTERIEDYLLTAYIPPTVFDSVNEMGGVVSSAVKANSMLTSPEYSLGKDAVNAVYDLLNIENHPEIAETPAQQQFVSLTLYNVGEQFTRYWFSVDMEALHDEFTGEIITVGATADVDKYEISYVDYSASDGAEVSSGSFTVYITVGASVVKPVKV